MFEDKQVGESVDAGLVYKILELVKFPWVVRPQPEFGEHNKSSMFDAYNAVEPHLMNRT